VPYILRKLRGPVRKSGPSNVGELTYALTAIILDYLITRNIPPRFQDYAEVLGALEATKLELHRRKIAIYEDEKCQINGDVF